MARPRYRFARKAAASCTRRRGVVAVQCYRDPLRGDVLDVLPILEREGGAQKFLTIDTREVNP